MASWSDVRRVALSLPGAAEGTTHGNISWTVDGKLFVWERPLRKSDLEALGPSAPTGAILGARTADLDTKDGLVRADPKVFFTTPHFAGYPAVLARLGKLTKAKLQMLVVEAWLARAPKRAVDAFLQERNRGAQAGPRATAASEPAKPRRLRLRELSGRPAPTLSPARRRGGR